MRRSKLHVASIRLLRLPREIHVDEPADGDGAIIVDAHVLPISLRDGQRQLALGLRVGLLRQQDPSALVVRFRPANGSACLVRIFVLSGALDMESSDRGLDVAQRRSAPSPAQQAQRGARPGSARPEQRIRAAR